MILSGYQEAAFSSFYTSRPFTSLASLSTPATSEVAAICRPALSTELLFPFLFFSLSTFTSPFYFPTVPPFILEGVTTTATTPSTAQERSWASTRLAPRVCRAGGRCRWPMDGHGRPAGTSDKGMTARAASCQSCPLRTLLSGDANSTPALAMMTRRCPGTSLVPKARTDTPCQSGLTSVPGPLLARAQGLLVPFRGSLGHSLA